MSTMTIDKALTTLAYISFGLLCGALIQFHRDKAQQPTLTYHGSSWTLEHVPMPPCLDGYRRTVDIPERDEVDALTVSCQAVR